MRMIKRAYCVIIGFMKAIKLLTALGNYETQYEPTRHNAGFWWLDCAINHFNLKWTQSPKNLGLMAKDPRSGLLFFKPTKLMNINGKPICQMANYFKIAPEHILIAYDDMDFDPGIIKLRNQGSAAGHNGIKSVLAHIANTHFFRLRIGIGRNAKIETARYVLTKPTNLEKQAINTAIEHSIKNIMHLLHNPQNFQEQLALWNKAWQKQLKQPSKNPQGE